MWHRILRKALFAFISEVLLSGAAHASPLPNIGAVVTMDVEFFGCTSLDDLVRVVNLDWVQNDKEASIAYGKQHCIRLRKGDQFRVQDVSVVQGAVCLRQAPSSDCYWTNAQMLKIP